MGSKSHRMGGLIRGGRETALSLSVHTEEEPREAMVRRWPSAGQEESPPQKLSQIEILRVYLEKQILGWSCPWALISLPFQSASQ